MASLRCFIVEDESMIADMLEDMLADAGHVVVGSAGSYESAMRSALSIACDVAILDVNLNGEQSFPIADVLAQRGVPVVFATGYGEGGIPERYDRARIVAKPYRSSSLLDAIGRASETAAGKLP